MLGKLEVGRSKIDGVPVKEVSEAPSSKNNGFAAEVQASNFEQSEEMEEKNRNIDTRKYSCCINSSSQSDW